MISEEIKQDIGLDQVNSLSDAMVVSDFVYELVSYGSTKTILDLEDTYKKLKKKEIGGRCGLQSEIFCWILNNCYKIPCYGYNHGLVGYDMTHVVSIIKLDQEYLIDSYFNKIYVEAKSRSPLTFDFLIKTIEQRDLKLLTEVRGPGKKLMEGQLLSSLDFEKRVYQERYNRGDNIKEVMKKVFATLDPRILLLIKIPGHIKREEYD
jgi:hypothetical protein